MSVLDLSSPILALESEQQVIACALCPDIDISEAKERLRPDHFAESAHRSIWALALQGPLDIGIAAQRLREDRALIDLGGTDYLADLFSAAQGFALHAHVDMVLDAAARRSLDMLARQAQSQCRLAGEGEAVTALLERGCADIARDSTTGSPASPVGLSANDNIDAALRGDHRGLSVGLAALDRATGGIKSDDVWVFGGRSSMGKSIVGLSLARAVAEQHRGVMMFSLEMSLREVQARMIADIGRDPEQPGPVLCYGDILRGSIGHDLRDRARVGAKRLAGLPMVVNDNCGLTIEDIRRQGLRQMRAWEKANVRPGAILIDHLGLVQPIRKTDSKVADTADTVNELKGIAKQLRCPIIALAQVNRGPENRSDKRPTMGDLNWSGSIEQIADFVCLLYRQSYYDLRSNEPDDIDRAAHNAHDLELLIQKNRAGETGVVRAWIDIAANAVRDAVAPFPSHGRINR